RYLLEDVDFDLEKGMVAPCDCRISCKEAFTDFLQRSAKLVQEETVEERKIMDMRKELSSLRSTAPYKKCSQCFDEVSLLFDRHVRVVRSQNTYVSDMNLRELIRQMDEEMIVKEVVDPLSNPLRLEIMKLMLDGSRSYTDLSVKTGLKGGNLLFHLQKLVTTGMISQNQERGDYALTEKGSKVLRYLTLITLDIGTMKWA
ncbi:MAG TPA: winged helix-turn-helix domain-containing protein, partial [Methanomassiliicoccales archaeon]|nr:winged helix-turn-helix domain-containing protein [Methanomassiliicoccales archaeon]